AILAHEPCPRHANRLGAERADHLPVAVTVAPAAPGILGPLIAAPPERGRQFLLEDRLDEGADPAAHTVLERIAPICAQQWRRRLRHRSVVHGVVSTAAATAGQGWVNIPETTPTPKLHHVRDSTL